MTDSSTTDDGSDGGNGNRANEQASELSYEIGDDEQPSEAVVRATAAHTGRSVIDLDPLFDVVDPDHLDGLYDDQGRERGLGERSVTFTFNGCRVSVTGEAVVVRSTDRTTG